MSKTPQGSPFQDSWPKALAIIRMISGLLLIYHGYEVFLPDQMKGYGDWLRDLHYPLPLVFAYAGKAAELLGGISLLFGIWVRWVTIPLIITLLLITFTMGHGKIFTDDQHPFITALLAAVFLCNGAGSWSLDEWLLRKKQNNETHIH